MNISAISSSTSVSYSFGNDSGIKQLQNQLKDLQKQVTAEGQSKDDTKTKQVKTQLLQTQIAQVERQIQQLQARKSTSSNISEQSAQETNTVATGYPFTNKLDVQA